ncbi:MAG TPA: DUF4082 domain-containing protein, partial [Saprospiraceae bacterium]|nr:DUF4082 domain-containing protein [Saprospiraceae bacterium]
MKKCYSALSNASFFTKSGSKYPLAIAFFIVFQSSLLAQVSLTTLGSAYTQDFNTLASSGTSSTVPAGWAFSESGSNANTDYAAGTGSSATGDTYSFGATSNTERAFRGLQSGNLVPTIGASFTNNTGSTVTSLAISYTGEQWRLGATGRTDRLDFQYSINATSLTTGSWTDVDNLDFNAPNSTGTVGAFDGNAAANRTAISSTITGLSIANGATFWIRWNSFDATGSDDGLAVDDFSLTPQGATVQPNLTINDVSLNEGNSGTTTFTFTVSLSAPAGPGGVTFDIATTDGTAVAPDDYTTKSLTGQTIPAGSSTYLFTVLVNGDMTVEPDETFFVNVTNVTGANVTDGQGQGMIVNDDVAAAPTITIIASSLNPSFTGNNVTFTATVTSSGNPVTLGTVTFSEGATVLAANVPLNGSGQAMFSTSVLTERNHVITATYNGATGFNTSNGSLVQVVNNMTVVNGNSFCNEGSITLADGNDGGSVGTPGTPYPSNIFVSGLSGTIQSITVDIKGLMHNKASDIDLLLVAPTGETFLMMTGAGSTFSNTNLTLSDAAGSALPQFGAISSGTYRPTSYEPDAKNIFPAPAPAGPYNKPAPQGASTFASVFNGLDPNGTWRLYATDDTTSVVGSIASGWCLNFTLPANCVPPTINDQPDAAIECAGEAASFTVAATGSGTLSYQWQEDGVNLSNGGVYSNVTTATLNISDVTGLDGKKYKVIVTNDNGTPGNPNDDCSTTSAEVTLTVNPTPIASLMAITPICAGASVQVTFVATVGVAPFDLVLNGETYADVADGNTLTINPYNLFDDNAVPNAFFNDGQAIELGVKFKATQPGFINGIRFYKGWAGTENYTGSLWSSTGTLLASATASLGGNGWLDITFSSPVAIVDNTTYVASFFSPSGNYAFDNPYFTTDIINGPLVGLQDVSDSSIGADGGNAIFRYTATSAFPTDHFGGENRSPNYWVDVLFVPQTFTISLSSITDANGCSATGNPISTATVTVNPLPTASVSAATSPICAGENAVFNLTGTANAEVTYNLNNSGNQTVNLDANGAATVTVNGATIAQTFNLVSVRNTSTNCSQTLTGTATVMVNQPATVAAGAAQTICQTKTVNLVNIGASIGGGAT